MLDALPGIARAGLREDFLRKGREGGRPATRALQVRAVSVDGERLVTHDVVHERPAHHEAERLKAYGQRVEVRHLRKLPVDVAQLSAVGDDPRLVLALCVNLRQLLVSTAPCHPSHAAAQADADAERFLAESARAARNAAVGRITNAATRPP